MTSVEMSDHSMGIRCKFQPCKTTDRDLNLSRYLFYYRHCHALRQQQELLYRKTGRRSSFHLFVRYSSTLSGRYTNVALWRRLHSGRT